MDSYVSMLPLPGAERPVFVNVDPKYECPSCKQTLWNPFQTSCGHRLCESCLVQLLLLSDPAECPVQEEYCEPISRQNNTVFKDMCARREIQTFKVFCSNKGQGCEEQVPLRSLQNHLESCMFSPVKCPHASYGCSAIIARCKLHVHTSECPYKPQQCPHCEQVVRVSDLQDHLEKWCPKIQISCPYGCDAKQIPREKITQHQNECELKPVECAYRAMGCTFVSTRSKMTEHIKMAASDHLELATKRISGLELENSQYHRKCQELCNEFDLLKQNNNDLMKENENFTTTVAQQSSKIKQLELNMVKQQERIIKLETTVNSVATKDDLQQHQKDVFEIKESHRDHEERIRQVETRSSTTGGATADGRRLQQFERQMGVYDVRLAEFDLRFQILETASYNGILLWKIRDYTRRKQDAVSRKTLSLYSQPFYTSRHGYKMCARVYLNGDGVGKNSHLSLFFVVMRGEYDALLPWPFRQKVTFMLLDQSGGHRHLSDSFRPDPTSTSFKRPTSDMNVASGCPLFVPKSVFSKKEYCDNDTIFFKIIVDTTGVSDP